MYLLYCPNIFFLICAQKEYLFSYYQTVTHDAMEKSQNEALLL